MPIQFRCPQCNKLLQTRDDAAGKQAKCPDCGTLVAVPRPGEAASADGPADAGPPPGAEGESPFGPGAAPPVPGVPNPYASPTTSGAAAGASVPGGEIRPTRIDLGDVFSQTWEIFKRQWGICLGVMLLVWLLTMLSYIFILIPIAGIFITMVIALWLGVGQLLVFLKIARGQPAEIGEIFSGGRYLLSAIGAYLLFLLMMLAIFGVCAGIPAAIGMILGERALAVLLTLGLAVAWVLTIIMMFVFLPCPFLIVDRDLGPIRALGLAAEVSRGNRLMLFVIWLLSVLINLAGELACCVGLLATVPFTTLLFCVTYLAMTGQPTAASGYSAPMETVPGGPFQGPQGPEMR